ncbi:MAG: gamma-glutamyltransferase [Microcoleus sp.]
MLQILNILQDTEIEKLDRQSADTVHLLAASMRIAYTDRAEYLGDPNSVRVPIEALTGRNYAKFRRSQIQISQARPSNEVKAKEGPILGEKGLLEVFDRRFGQTQSTLFLNLFIQDNATDARLQTLMPSVRGFLIFYLLRFGIYNSIALAKNQ